MKNKVLIQLVEWINNTPSINRKLLKEKIEELDNASITKPRTKKVSVRFIPPSIEEIKNYCKERNNGINAEQFFDFYQSKNWMIGKNKMKDFKAAVRTWERNRHQTESETKYGRMNEEQAYGTFNAANNVKIPGI